MVMKAIRADQPLTVSRRVSRRIDVIPVVFQGRAAPAANNTDKEIETNFGAVGFDYNLNRDWGMSVKVPYWFRTFRTDIGVPGAPDVQTYRHNALRDIRVLGTYTGFSPDMWLRPDRSPHSTKWASWRRPSR